MGVSNEHQNDFLGGQDWHTLPHQVVVAALAGSQSGKYPADYLDVLRSEWPD